MKHQQHLKIRNVDTEDQRLVKTLVEDRDECHKYWRDNDTLIILYNVGEVGGIRFTLKPTSLMYANRAGTFIANRVIQRPFSLGIHK